MADESKGELTPGDWLALIFGMFVVLLSLPAYHAVTYNGTANDALLYAVHRVFFEFGSFILITAFFYLVYVPCTVIALKNVLFALIDRALPRTQPSP